MSHQPSSTRPDRGSASVLALGIVGVVAVLLTAGLLIGVVAVTGQEARTAADLAALAGAGELASGHGLGPACARATEVAALNDAELVSCVAGAAGDGAALLPVLRVEVTASVGTTSWTVRAVAAATGIADVP